MPTARAPAMHYLAFRGAVIGRAGQATDHFALIVFKLIPGPELRFATLWTSPVHIHLSSQFVTDVTKIACLRPVLDRVT